MPDLELFATKVAPEIIGAHLDAGRDAIARRDDDALSLSLLTIATIAELAYGILTDGDSTDVTDVSTPAVMWEDLRLTGKDLPWSQRRDDEPDDEPAPARPRKSRRSSGPSLEQQSPRRQRIVQLVTETRNSLGMSRVDLSDQVGRHASTTTRFERYGIGSDDIEQDFVDWLERQGVEVDV